MSTREDRIKGVLLGQACGDALGVPYESSHRRPPARGEAVMGGGGFGSYEPGQWSDDTECAVMIAFARSEPGAVAANLLAWMRTNPPDAGPTSRRVLGGARTPAEVPVRARQAAEHRTPGSVSNGSLMRTGPVALPYLGDRDRIAEAARELSDLTHADEYAGDACVLWSLAIDRAVELGGVDVSESMTEAMACVPAGRRAFWRRLVREAVSGRRPSRDNWSGVGAFKAALWSVSHAESLEDGLQLAVSIGGDTDTVAAIAGALLGGMHGAGAVPEGWRREVHGWPGLRAPPGLEALALFAAGEGPAPGVAAAPGVLREWAGPDAGYHACTEPGVRHWGVHGAAGVVPVAEVNGVPFVLLAKRSKAVQNGGTWSSLGGAVDEGEDAWHAALREAGEEVSGVTVAGEPLAELDAPCSHGCGWGYHTFMAEVPVSGKLPRVSVRRGASSWETDAVRWVPAAEVDGLNLHPGFAASWPELRERLTGGEAPR